MQTQRPRYRAEELAALNAECPPQREATLSSQLRIALHHALEWDVPRLVGPVERTPAFELIAAHHTGIVRAGPRVCFGCYEQNQHGILRCEPEEMGEEVEVLELSDWVVDNDEIVRPFATGDLCERVRDPDLGSGQVAPEARLVGRLLLPDLQGRDERCVILGETLAGEAEHLERAHVRDVDTPPAQGSHNALRRQHPDVQRRRLEEVRDSLLDQGQDDLS